MDRILCLRCGAKKSLSEYDAPPSGKYNRVRRCTQCRKEQQREYAAKRRAYAKDTIRMKPLLRNRDGLRCAHCRFEYDYEELAVDHIWPVSRADEFAGNVHSLDNLQLLCKSCNSRKGNQLPGESKDAYSERIRRNTNYYYGKEYPELDRILHVIRNLPRITHSSVVKALNSEELKDRQGRPFRRTGVSRFIQLAKEGEK